MTKIVTKTKKTPYFLLSIFTLCFTFILGAFAGTGTVFAQSYSATPDDVSSRTNLNFAYNNNTTSVYSSPTGWTKVKVSQETTSGVINVAHYNEAFKLTTEQTPAKMTGGDDHILMINAKTGKSTLPASAYYTNTSDFNLNPYSHYVFRVYTKVLEDSKASIYLSGLQDSLSFENIGYTDANEWTPYTFYISTGIKAEKVKLQLWLGQNPNYTSNGAVFFDNVEFKQISENKIEETAVNTKYLNLNESELISTSNAGVEINSNFENNTLTDWTQIKELSTDSYAEIIDLSDKNDSVGKGIEYLGTDYSKNNNKALALYTKNDSKSYIGYKSKEIDLPMYEIVKISLNAKLSSNFSGSAYIKVVENDVLDFSGNKIDAITPNSQTITISSNSDNKFINNYTNCSFYLKGRSLYNTSFKLELWLGSEEAPASGLVVFDNIKIESLSYAEFSSVTSDGTNVVMNFDSDPAKYNISNSAFNNVEKKDRKLNYPLLPTGWTRETNDESDTIFGVVNTNDNIYNPADFAGFANPGNPNGFSTDTSKETNNILVVHNLDKTYQIIKSSNFNIVGNSYYKLSFEYKIMETHVDSNNILNIYIEDDEQNVIYANENIAQTSVDWKNYTIYINTKDYSNTLNLILSLGTKENPVQGVAYFDNVMLQRQDSMTQEQYEELSKDNNVLDFEQGNFNLVKKDKDGLYIPLRYTEKLENDDYSGSGLPKGIGRIIDTKETDKYEIEKSPNYQGALNYLMMIETFDKATYTLTANDSLSLVSDTYHKFSIDIKTTALQKDLEYDEKYGAIFALSGLEEKFEGIISDEWTTYTIYVACTASSDLSIQFGLASLDDKTAGIAFFDNFKYESLDKDAYNIAKLNLSEEKTNLFIGNTDAENEEDKDNTSSANLEYIWYVIPSLILGIALVLALVAYLMKKVKIKKWEKRRINEYDRENTVHRDVIRAEAEKRRDAEVKELKKSISVYEEEKNRIEGIHQEKLKSSRAERAKGISRNTEREFKQYAKLHTAIENRIATTNKQIEKLNTAEYLLSLQHKIMLEKAKEERIAKEKSYNKEKAEKSKKKKSK